MEAKLELAQITLNAPLELNLFCGKPQTACTNTQPLVGPPNSRWRSRAAEWNSRQPTGRRGHLHTWLHERLQIDTLSALVTLPPELESALQT